ncbi:MFS transporter [Arachnia rubra]|jgi:putative MFS transporter|uniref:MFS transporter n=1 Tax=Arachnia rubra TaxID=1547448 RepID=A0ABX7Y981_9ACTN|nr:MFS transporter [Arachnia rubra]MBB1570002.1 MFS transporter [Propionibacterium sp.]MDO4644165.1 MFS transporter [Propionibacteriaceae bacterium]MBB1576236.1 MFS transporter [Propionibacterium sp.]QUC09390.1 MFS transporter [Arachnia rubra]BCR80874.1 MFS transporter [Arachnia rubra]
MLAALHNRTYARLFTAQVLALIGTGLLTVALGLLAVEVAGDDAGIVMGTALTIRIIAFVTISPVMSALVNRLPRTTVLVGADAVRAAMALCLPFVTDPWQIYLLIFGLQAASATFTPAFQATIPQVLPDEDDYTAALSLSRLAYDLESLLSPALAAVLLTVMSYHNLFMGTALGFVASIALVIWARLPAPVPDVQAPFMERLTRGARIFGRTPELRGLMAFNMSVACGIAMVLVNTAVLVKTHLHGDDSGVAWLLVTYGAGSMLVALALPSVLKRLRDYSVMLAGAVLLPAGLALSAAAIGMSQDVAQWIVLDLIWFLLGAATSLISTPSSRLLRRSCEAKEQPAVFAAQFSLSHACYLIGYPTAGWLGASLGLPAAALLLAFLAAVSGAMAWALARVRSPRG